MFELHIEFSTASLVLNFTDREDLESACEKFFRNENFISIYKNIY